VSTYIPERLKAQIEECDRIFYRPLAKDTFARGREKVKGKRGKGFILPFSLNLYPFSDFCKKSYDVESLTFYPSGSNIAPLSSEKVLLF
jgi:hypothetical protein